MDGCVCVTVRNKSSNCVVCGAGETARDTEAIALLLPAMRPKRPRRRWKCSLHTRLAVLSQKMQQKISKILNKVLNYKSRKEIMSRWYVPTQKVGNNVMQKMRVEIFRPLESFSDISVALQIMSLLFLIEMKTYKPIKFSSLFSSESLLTWTIFNTNKVIL